MNKCRGKEAILVQWYEHHNTLMAIPLVSYLLLQKSLLQNLIPKQRGLCHTVSESGESSSRSAG